MAGDPRERLRALVSEALQEIGDRPLPSDRSPAKPLPTLLEQCRDLAEEARSARPPIRIIDHFACTGGTLISKCVAALPNVHLFSEIEPQSLVIADQPRFAPTDLIYHLRGDLRGVPETLIEEVFFSGVQTIYEYFRREGGELVFRGHAHSIYCSDRPTAPRSLRELCAERYATRLLITVRHPMESYLSAHARNWLTFDPPGIDAYALRYHAFLDEAGPCEPIKYEDFVKDPYATLESICMRLELPFEPVVLELFGAVRLSGDSGRTGEVIGRRAPKAPPADVLDAAKQSEAYARLLDRLDYSHEA